MGEIQRIQLQTVHQSTFWTCPEFIGEAAVIAILGHPTHRSRDAPPDWSSFLPAAVLTAPLIALTAGLTESSTMSTPKPSTVSETDFTLFS